MSEKVVRYKCGYCEKLFKTEKGAENHELHRCWHSEKSQTCFTCGLFVDEEVEEDSNLYLYGIYGHPKIYRFNGEPKCVDHHDMYYECLDGVTRAYDNPHRQFECGMYEPREDHPGEYVKFKTGLGGYRRVYLKHEDQA